MTPCVCVMYFIDLGRKTPGTSRGIPSKEAGESSNTAEDLTERRRRQRVRLAGSATKFSQQVLDSVAEMHRSSTRKSCDHEH